MIASHRPASFTHNDIIVLDITFVNDSIDGNGVATLDELKFEQSYSCAIYLANLVRRVYQNM